MEFHSSRGRLTDVEKPDDLFRIAFIERKHKRRIVNFEELVASCNLWQLPEGTKYNRVECWAINLDDSEKYLENLSQLRSVDALVSRLAPIICAVLMPWWIVLPSVELLGHACVMLMVQAYLCSNERWL